MKKSKQNSEQGVALLFVLLALLLLTAIAAGLMYMSDSETSINLNYKQEQQSYFAAKAGLEEVRDRMRGNAPNTLSAVLPITTPAAAGGVLYVINQGTDPTAITPWAIPSAYADDEFCHEGYTYGGLFAQGNPGVRCTAVPAGATWYTQPVPVSTAPGAGTAAAIPYKWVRVTWKENQSVNGYSVDPGFGATTPICWNGTTNTEVALNTAISATCQGLPASLTPVYTLAALAVTPTGARRMVQEEVAKPTLPPVPSALTLDGAGTAPFFGTPHSNNFGIAGADACTANKVPGIGVVDNPDQVGVTADIFRPSNYTGSGGTTPDVETLNSSQIGPFQTVSDLQKMVSNIVALDPNPVIDPLHPPSPLPDFGTPGSPSTATVTVIAGDWGGPCNGNGILLVLGNLTCSGGTSFDGLIAVIGPTSQTTTANGGGNLLFNGGGSGQINGAVFVANLADATGALLPGSAAPGIPKFAFNGGGSNFIQFNSCDLNNALNNAPYPVIASHEISY